MSDRVVVITGASAGIGASLAVQLGRAGDRLVLVARREAQLAEVAARAGKDALCVKADVTRRAEVDAACKRGLERFGRIDVRVNNAGRGMSRLASELTDEDLDEMMLVNVKSALYGVQAQAQPVEEVAAVIAGVIAHPRADVYTRPGARELVAGYFAAEDMGRAEAEPPFVMRPQARP